MFSKEEKHLIFIIICCLCAAFCFKGYSNSNSLFHLIGGICWTISGILKLYEYLENKDGN